MSLPRLLEVEEFFANPEFSGASISPDGKRIAYLAPWEDRRNLYVRGLEDTHAEAVRVTHDKRRGITQYFWTKEPRWMLYLQDTDGNEDWHLYRVDLDNPEAPAVDLTPIEPGSRVFSAEPMKSKPGTFLVTMNRRAEYIDVFQIDISTGETRVHLENPEKVGGWIIGPNGELFYNDQAEEDAAYRYYSVEVDAAGAPGEKRHMITLTGPDYPVGIFPTMVAPDGGGLLMAIYNDSDDLSLWRVDGKTGERTIVAAVQGHSICTMGGVAPTMPPSHYLSKRTGELLAVRFVGDRPIIKIVDPQFADIYDRIAALSDGVLAGLSSDETETLWVASFVHDREPGLTYLYDHSTGESTLLFRPFPQLNPDELAPMTPVSFTARDGLPMHAFLTLPLGVEPKGLPLVLFVHGGPWCHDMWTYNPIAQFFANRGYAVLQANFRGSSGYGRKHITSAIKQLAGTMHDDLIDACEWAVAEGIADKARIGIYGGSYGGYSALVGVTVTPDYFAAAVDYVGISSLTNFMKTLPLFVRPGLRNNWIAYAGDPDNPDDLADMLTRSPITMVDKIVTPLLVAQGANDARVVQAESDVMVEALRARGVSVEYLLAEDEGHGFQNPENNYRLYRAVEKHFGEFLGGRTSA